jgi:hypothetical protein
MKEYIGGKIEEICQKPESVRIRYVWGSVSVVMVLIFLFWIVTLRSGFKASAPDDVKSIQEAIPASMKDIEAQGESISSMMEATKSFSSEGANGSIQSPVR